MAEAARRTGYGHGSDVVRRLIARPIRMHGGPSAEPAALERPPVGTQPVAAPAAVDGEAPSPDIARLRTEMMMLKAVLRAERNENANLRACLGFDEADETLSDDARAMRDRWASLVDRLLHASA